MLRYLSNFFGTRLVVPEYCIDKLEHIHIILHCDFLFLMVKEYFWDETYNQDFDYITRNFILSRMFK